MKNAKIAVALIIVLMLSLPICTAQQLEITGFNGRDRVQEYAQTNDDLNMQVKALLPGDEITPDQIEVCLGNLCKNPSVCTPGEPYYHDKYYDCRYTEILRDMHGRKTYAVKLLDNDKSTIKTATAFLEIDENSPIVTGLELSPEATKDRTSIKINALDFGSSTRDASYCSGIDKIEFYEKDSGKILATRNYGYEQCNIDEIFQYDHKTSKKSEKIMLCARATDLFGQESNELCKELTYDNGPPEIKSLSFADRDGNPVSHITSKGANVDLVVEIDDDSEISEARADFSAIRAGPEKRFDYKKENKYYWKDFKIMPSTQCTGTITAADVMDNTANKTLNCQTQVDDQQPQIQSIETSLADIDGMSIIAPGSQIKATILEDGVGLYKKQIYADLGELGLGKNIQADSCTKDGAIWTCYWNNIVPNVAEGDYQIMISQGLDDLGNRITQPAMLPVETYSKSAMITQISHYPIGPTSEDTIEFTIRVKDSKTQPSVYVDAAKISNAQFPKQATCGSAGIDEWECYVDVGNVIEQYITTAIKFYTQESGTKQEVPYEITVYEPEPAAGADLYTLQGVSIIPSKGFDRRNAYQIAYPVYLQPRLKQKSPNPDVKTIDKAIQCSAEDISDYYMINELSDEPIIVIKGSPAIADRAAPVKVNCTLTMRVKQGERIFNSQEIETFSVNIPVYNNPLGNISQNAQAQIDQINQNLEKLWDREKTWDNANDNLGWIARITQTIMQLDATGNYIGAALWAVAAILYQLKSIPILGPFCEFISQVLWKFLGCGIYNNGMHSFFLEYIWTPGLIGSETFNVMGYSGLGDVTKALGQLARTFTVIYSCQLCDYGSSLESVLKQAVYGNTNMGIKGTTGKPTVIESYLTYDYDPYKSIHVAMACLCLPGIVYGIKKERQINCIYRNCVQEHAKLGLPFDSCQQTLKEQNCLYVDGAAWRVSGGNIIAPLLSEMLPRIFEQIGVVMWSEAWTDVCDPECGLLKKQESKDSGGGEGAGTGGEGAGSGDTASHETGHSMGAGESAGQAGTGGAAGTGTGGGNGCSSYGAGSGGGSDNSAYPEECADDPLDDWEVPLCGVWAATLVLQETDYFQDNRYPWEKFWADLEGEDYCD